MEGVNCKLPDEEMCPLQHKHHILYKPSIGSLYICIVDAQTLCTVRFALAQLSNEKIILLRPNSSTLSTMEAIFMHFTISPVENSIASTIDCVPKLSSITLVRYVEEDKSSWGPTL